MPGIEPGAFHMRSERSTTELHPLLLWKPEWEISLLNNENSQKLDIKLIISHLHMTAAEVNVQQPIEICH